MVSFSPKRLMVIHAHPDDESLFTGHVIAEALRQGAEVSLITLTRGERGHSLNPDLRRINHNPAEMAHYRSNLLVRASEVFEGLNQSFFGKRAYLETNQDSVGLGRFTHPDPLYNLTLTGSGVKVIADELVPQIKAFRPDTIVTLAKSNPNSDHAISNKAVRRAIKLIGASKPPVHLEVVDRGHHDLVVGSSFSEPLKRQAISTYSDFVTIRQHTYDYGTGELKFSDPEKLRVVR